MCSALTGQKAGGFEFAAVGGSYETVGQDVGVDLWQENFDGFPEIGVRRSVFWVHSDSFGDGAVAATGCGSLVADGRQLDGGELAVLEPGVLDYAVFVVVEGQAVEVDGEVLDLAGYWLAAVAAWGEIYVPDYWAVYPVDDFLLDKGKVVVARAPGFGEVGQFRRGEGFYRLAGGDAALDEKLAMVRASYRIGVLTLAIRFLEPTGVVLPAWVLVAVAG